MAKSNRSNLWWVFLIFVAVGAIALWPRRSAKGLIPWQTNYAAAASQARAGHKLIVLDFYADWCGPCRAMAAETWSDPKVAQVMTGYIPVQVNVDDQPKLAAQFGVDGIPNVILLDGNGAIIAAHAGQMEPMQFLDWLQEARSHSS